MAPILPDIGVNAAGGIIATLVAAVGAAVWRRVRARREQADAGARERESRHRGEDAVAAYRQERVATLSARDRGASDALFTRLSLLLPRAEGAGDAWKEQEVKYSSLKDVLTAHTEYFAVVLLGDPGAGKSTLLQRLELDVLRENVTGNALPISFSAELRKYDGPTPKAWLTEQWQLEQEGVKWRTHRELPDLEELLRRPGSTLLLDGLNEMRALTAGSRHALVRDWAEYLDYLRKTCPGCRVVFSCRSLDYSGLLSTAALPVPHLYIEKIGVSGIREFLGHYLAQESPDDWERLAGELTTSIVDSEQEGLYGTAYFLRMLVRVAARTRTVPADSAALFTAFIRELVRREREQSNALLIEPGPLDAVDLERLSGQLRTNAWDSPYALPEGGPLFPTLADLAYTMQVDGTAAEGSQLLRNRDWAPRHLGRGVDRPFAHDVFKAAVALNILEEREERTEDLEGGARTVVQFVHQLMQEYFAGRHLAKAPRPDLARVGWLAEDVPPIPADLPDKEPLPPLSTPWDETTLFAVTMADDRVGFVERLTAFNLPLAGRAAARNRHRLPEATVARVQTELLARMSDDRAGLRARIDAGKALGGLGDPRFDRRPVAPVTGAPVTGAPRTSGRPGCLTPPTLPIPAGRYEIGSDAPVPPWKEANKAPRCTVEVRSFEVARFAVTNAEWRRFQEAGGYDQDDWWRSEAAKSWRRGESTYDCWAHMWRIFRDWLQSEDRIAERLWERGEITRDEKDSWVKARDDDGATFDRFLEDQRKERVSRLTKPAGWSIPAFNNDQQPVSGICWFEAQAYGAWLSAQTGESWRLPSEAEWEVAARWGTDRLTRYPWGDDFDDKRCNTSATRIRATTPAGIFPAGNTASGLSDVSGNVFEWTSSKYLDYPWRPDDGRDVDEAQSDPTRYATRVLRGGSWYYGREYARLAFRLHYHPGFRARTAGFRLVRVERPAS